MFHQLCIRFVTLRLQKYNIYLRSCTSFDNTNNLQFRYTPLYSRNLSVQSILYNITWFNRNNLAMKYEISRFEEIFHV